MFFPFIFGCQQFNARSESIGEKASFRRLIPKNRCLVAVEGYGCIFSISFWCFCSSFLLNSLQFVFIYGCYVFSNVNETQMKCIYSILRSATSRKCKAMTILFVVPSLVLFTLLSSIPFLFCNWFKILMLWSGVWTADYHFGALDLVVLIVSCILDVVAS